MIDERSVTDREALAAVKGALNELMMRFPLAGLSCLGDAVVLSEYGGIQTLDTDGRSIRYAPSWILKSTPRSRVFDLLHEWLHIFFNHVLRCGDRDQSIWNEACDIIVVAECCRVLSARGEVWEPPEDGVIPPKWAEGLTAEEIYDRMKTTPSMRPKPKPGTKEPEDAGEEGSGSAGEIGASKDFNYAGAKTLANNPEKEDAFYRKFSEELAQANLIMQQVSSKDSANLYGPVIGSRLEKVLRGRVPWGRLLKGNLLQAFGDEFASYSPPKRRHYPFIILPSLRSRKEKTLLIAIDDSASVGDRLHKEFVANVLPAALRAEKVVVVTFDQVIREEIHTTRPKTILSQMKFLTGYHSYTSVKGVFDIASKVNPTAIAILTDGHVEDLPEKPFHNTLWCIPINGKKQPWGKNYVMDVSW